MRARREHPQHASSVPPYLTAPGLGVPTSFDLSTARVAFLYVPASDKRSSTSPGARLAALALAACTTLRTFPSPDSRPSTPRGTCAVLQSLLGRLGALCQNLGVPLRRVVLSQKASAAPPTNKPEATTHREDAQTIPRTSHCHCGARVYTHWLTSTSDPAAAHQCCAGCRVCNGNKSVESRTPRSAAGREQSVSSRLDACGAISDRSCRRSFRNGPRVRVPWRSTARPTSHGLAVLEGQRPTRRIPAKKRSCQRRRGRARSA